MKRYYLDKLALDNHNRLVPSIKLSQAWADEQLANPDAAYSVVTGDSPAAGQDCLLVLNAKNHADLGKLTGVDLLPDFPLDSKVGSMHGPTKLAMRAVLVARGVPASVTDNADGFRDIVEYVAKTKLNNAGFDADNFEA